jgi:putative ABC transport system permease protein
MHFLPILSTLRRHRTAAALIVLEIALTCAIVCNAVFLISDRLAKIDAPSGLAEEGLLVVQATGLGARNDAAAITAQDLVALRALPSVTHVSVSNMIPFGNSVWTSGVSNRPDDQNSPVEAAMYMGVGLIATMGIELTAGRDFTPSEYVDFEDVQADKVTIPAVIVSRSVADTLYPGKSPLGLPLYSGKDPQVIVGVFDHIATSTPRQDHGWAVFHPVRVPFTNGAYLLRVDPPRAGETLVAAEAALKAVDAHRIILRKLPFGEVRADFFRADRSMAWLLAGISIALLVITALGVVGLASFWVQQRTRQIGVRRALGATRGDILRYFQTENFILATCGIALGMALAYALNLWLMDRFQVERMPASYLPIGAAVLWALGQIAVLGPALRASLIPPAIATRSV